MPDPVEVSPASDRGQVGIGTLVVFIAMVLVAAIAAGVLLDTAGFLQSKSEVVGQESSEQVTDRLQVVSTIGHVSSASEQVTVKVHNETHLKLAGWDKEDGSKSSITVEEGKTVYLQGIGINSGETTDFIFGDQSITFTFDELTTTNPNNHAKVRFEVLDGGEVRLYDELEGRAVGVVDGPVRVQASPGETLLFGTQMGQFDHKIGNEGDSDPANPPAGSSYVPNHTEQRDRSGPLDVVENVSVTVRPSSGSSEIDLTEATITYVSDHETARLTHTDGEPTGTTFATTVLKGSDSVIATDEQATIRLNSTLIGDTDTSLRPGESVQLNVVTQSGASTTVTFTVPRTLTGETAVSL